MTVSTLTSRVTYIGNGSATSFSVPFKVLDEDHLVVKRRVLSTNEIDYSYIGTDYSYSGIGDDAGTLTLDGAALSSLYQIEIERVVPYTQELDIVNAGGFYPETVEEQLDLTAMQIQQIATQSDDIETRALMVPIGDEAPTYDEFAATFKGDPGGNAMAVGSFAAISGLTIAAGTDRIRTDDGVDYVYDAAVDVDYVVANPLTSKLTLNGRGYRLALDQVLRPYMFAAEEWDNSAYVPGDLTASAPNAYAGLQAFFTFIFSGIACKADFTGLWAVGTGIVIGPSSATAQRRVHLIGNATIVATAAIDTLVTWRHMKETMLHGTLRLVGIGDAVYANRTCRDAFKTTGNNAGSGVTGAITCYRFQRYGVYLHTVLGEFTEWFSCPQVQAFSCGSGADPSFPTYTLRSTWNTRVDQGSSGSTGQATRVTVGTLPPSFLDAQLTTEPLAVNIAGKIRQVMAIDRATSKIDVYPWLLASDAASGTLDYIFGGAVCEAGPDGNVANIGTVSGLNCGYARLASSAYPGMFHNVTAQSCGLALGVGVAPSSTCLGGGESDLYIEGNCIQEVAIFTGGFDPLTANLTFKIGLPHTYDLTKWWALGPNDGTTEDRMYGFRALELPDAVGKWFKGTNDVARGYADIDVAAGNFVQSWYGDTHVVRLLPFSAARYDVLGRDGCILVFMGTGANHQPTGTVTIDADDIAGETVNGGATAIYSALKGPLMLHVRADPTTGAFVCERLGMIPAVAMADIGADPSQADFNTLLAKLRASGALAT